MKIYNFEFENKKVNHKFMVISDDQFTAFQKAKRIVRENIGQKGELFITSIM